MAKKIERVELKLTTLAGNESALFGTDAYGRLWQLKDNVWNRIINPIGEMEVDVPDEAPQDETIHTEAPAVEEPIAKPIVEPAAEPTPAEAPTPEPVIEPAPVEVPTSEPA